MSSELGVNKRPHKFSKICACGGIRALEMEKVIVFGNSVFAEYIYFLLTEDSQYEVAAFTVDSKYMIADELFGLPVISFETVERDFPPAEYKMMVALSFQRVNKLREERYLQAKNKGYHFINYINSRAATYPNLDLGENCIILENSIIGPFVKIGNNVFVGSGTIIGHHAVIKDHCFISPGAVVLGGVTVGENCLIGANATVKEEVKIARECIVGSGVSLTKHTKDKEVYINQQAELLTKKSDELRQLITWPLRVR